MEGKLIKICISKEKGTKKEPVDSALLVPDHGIKDDAHAGKWHRQISILGLESIEDFKDRGADVNFGDFGENLVIRGIDMKSLPVGTLLRIGETEIETTQIGKECHSHCRIYEMVGDCIMPREGVFAKVIKGGRIMPGDTVKVEAPPEDRPYTCACITLSDKGAAGERQDESGPLMEEMMKEAGYEVIEQMMIPDDYDKIVNELSRIADMGQADLILTTGGTGFAPRDVTPEATEEVCDRMAPGISEAIRAYSMTKTPRAMLSRGVSGIRNRTLIINLPGSPRAVRECLEFLIPNIAHGIEVLTGRAWDCAQKQEAPKDRSGSDTVDKTRKEG